MTNKNLEQLVRFLRKEGNTDKNGVYFSGHVTVKTTDSQAPCLEMQGTLHLAEQMAESRYVLTTGEREACFTFALRKRKEVKICTGEYVRVPIECIIGTTMLVRIEDLPGKIIRWY